MHHYDFRIHTLYNHNCHARAFFPSQFSHAELIINGQSHISTFQVLQNGNLMLPPFRAEDYNQEVHAQTYRCIAENTFGKIQSRDVHVRAGIAENFYTIPFLAENYYTGKHLSKNCSADNDDALFSIFL